MSEPTEEVISNNTVNDELSKEEVEHLRRVKLIEETKHELVAWAKRQAWLLFVVISVLGAFGATLIIKSMVAGQVRTEVNREVERVEKAFAPIQEVLASIQLVTLEAKLEGDRVKQGLTDMEEQRDRVQAVLSSQETDAAQLKTVFADLEADINNLRQGIKVQSESLQAQVEQIVSVLKSAKTQVDISPQKSTLLNFNSNSEFTILVFYTPSQKINARAIEQALLSLGYRSSITATDFSELAKRHPSGTIYVTHTNRGSEALKNIEKIASKLDLSSGLVVQKSNSALRRGDAQILIF